jgi:hypothetical protein
MPAARAGVRQFGRAAAMMRAVEPGNGAGLRAQGWRERIAAEPAQYDQLPPDGDRSEDRLLAACDEALVEAAQRRVMACGGEGCDERRLLQGGSAAARRVALTRHGASATADPICLQQRLQTTASEAKQSCLSRP